MKKSLNILFATAHPTLPEMSGGMQSSANELALLLTEKGHKVSFLCGLVGSSPLGIRARFVIKALRRKAARDKVMGYPVWRAWFPWESMAWVVARVRPDVVLIQAGEPVRMALAAQRAGVPVVMKFQDVYFEGLGGELSALGDVTCTANSRFTAERYREKFGLEAKIIYPMMNMEQYRTPTTRENVTFINPHPLKGLDVAIAVARQCPDIPFSFVGAWWPNSKEASLMHEQVADVPNITFRDPVSDMRQVYGKCRILLAPSLCEEGFGRVACEAQCSGIPVVASNRGGLPEAVGAGGVLLDPEGPVEEWVAAIRKLWSDPAYYAALSAAALKHAASPELGREVQAALWEEVLASAAAPAR